MKQFKTLLIVAVIALGFNTMNAQSKVAHINFMELVSLMPEAKAMQADLEKLSKTYQDELKAENDKLEAKLKRYDTEAASQTNEVNQQRVAEVQQDQQKLQLAGQQAQKDISNQETELMKPIVEKARKAIEEVATEQGFDYVLGAQTLVVAKGKDLLPLVKAKLGIQ